MPSDDGLRLEDIHRVQHLGSQVIEPRKHQAIDIADGNPLGRPTPQHIELMPKGENFGLQGSARPEEPSHGMPANA
jgi:S-ribosylhomocysteine lyase LuxS involved in autoinducer biosynthesis